MDSSKWATSRLLTSGEIIASSMSEWTKHTHLSASIWLSFKTLIAASWRSSEVCAESEEDSAFIWHLPSLNCIPWTIATSSIKNPSFIGACCSLWGRVKFPLKRNDGSLYLDHWVRSESWLIFWKSIFWKRRSSILSLWTNISAISTSITSQKAVCTWRQRN